MLLKRIYDTPKGWERKVNLRAFGSGLPIEGALADPTKSEGACLNPPPFKHIEVKHTGTHAEQNFSERLVRAGLGEGWITLSAGKLTLHAKPEDLAYAVKRLPGHYCCHCGAAIPDAAAFASPGLTVGAKHVAEAHAGKASPDPQNPSGYERLNHYECTLDSAQHAKFRLGSRSADEPKSKRTGRH